MNKLGIVYVMAVAISLVLFSGCSTPEKRANQLLIKAEALLAEAGPRDKEDFVAAGPLYKEAHDNLRKLLNAYAKSAIVARMVEGAKKISGFTLHDWLYRVIPFKLEAARAEADLLETALLLANHADDAAGISVVRLEIGRFYLHHGRRERVLPLISETMLAILDITDPMVKSRLFTTMADLLFELGLKERAREALDQAFLSLPVEMKEMDDTYWNDTRADMGRLYAEFAEPGLAAKAVATMGEWGEGASFDPGWVNDSALTVVASILLRNNRPDLAFPIIDQLAGSLDLNIVTEMVERNQKTQAIQMLERVKDKFQASASLLSLSRLWDRLGKPEDAQTALSKAVSAAESIAGFEVTESDENQGYSGEDMLSGTLDMADELDKRGASEKAESLRAAALAFVERCNDFSRNRGFPILARYFAAKKKPEMVAQIIGKIEGEDSKKQLPLVLADGYLAAGDLTRVGEIVSQLQDQVKAGGKEFSPDMIESIFDFCLKLNKEDEALALIDRMGSPGAKATCLLKLVDPLRRIGLSNEKIVSQFLQHCDKEASGLVQARHLLDLVIRLGNTENKLEPDAHRIVHGWIAGCIPSPLASDEKDEALKSYVIRRYFQGDDKATLPGGEVTLYREVTAVVEPGNAPGRVLALNCAYPDVDNPGDDIWAAHIPYIAFITPYGYVRVIKLPGERFNIAVGDGCFGDDTGKMGKNKDQTCQAIDLDHDGVQEILVLTYEEELLASREVSGAFMALYSFDRLLMRLDLDDSRSETFDDEGIERVIYQFEACEFSVLLANSGGEGIALTIDSDFKKIQYSQDKNGIACNVRFAAPKQPQEETSNEGDSDQI